MDPNTVFDPFSALRDIHLPEPISWWPPAPGWWIGLGLGVVVLGYLVTLGCRWWRSPRRAALRELETLKLEFEACADQIRLIRTLSKLLRRCILTTTQDHRVAGVVGQRWLALLDETGRTSLFTEGAGRVLAENAYARSPAYDPSELLALTSAWIRQAMPAVRYLR